MATNIGVSLQLDDIQLVHDWLVANAAGRAWDMSIQRYRDDAGKLLHRHVVTVDDDAFAILIKFELAKYLIPGIKDETSVLPAPRSFAIQPGYWSQAIEWLVNNAKGKAWNMWPALYSLNPSTNIEVQIISIVDSEVAIRFKLENMDAILNDV